MNSRERFEKLVLREIGGVLILLFNIGIIPEACRPMVPFLAIEISSILRIPFL